MVRFQVVCWRGDDEDIDDVDRDEDEEEQKKQYRVRLFGKTIEGRSICCVVDFFPYFFVALRKGTSVSDAMHTRDRIAASMGRTFRDDVVSDACVLVKRKKFYGFTNGEQHPFLRMVFRTRHAYAVAAKILQSEYDLFESNVDPILKLIHCRDLESAGWIEVVGGRDATTKKTTCDLEIVARYDALSRSEAEASAAPLVIASFDIEAFSRDGGFPNPDEDGNEIIQIATVFQRYGEPDPFVREVLCLGDTAPLAGVKVRCFRTEAALLAAWSRSVRDRNVDVLLGYNINGFDWSYMYRRIIFHYDDDERRTEFLGVGRLLDHQAALRKSVLASSAYGHNEYQILETPGILQIDLLQVLRREHKLESYSLNAVSKHFLSDAKVDMPARTMFELYATGDPENRRKIAEYCVKDAELPLRLLTMLAVLPNMIEMAKATHVPLEFLIPRGQQIKVFSQILKRLRDRGYVCPANPKRPHTNDGNATYAGATVLEPKRGAYMDHPIATLDFASLYPSIMRSSRLCPSTIVLDPAYDDLPGVEYLTLDVEGSRYRFAQNTADAIVPDLLRDLAQYRKQAKKDMADAKKRGDAFMTSVYDGKQMAIKVSMNSVYGFFGATNGFLPCAPIAAAVTSIGRDMILRTKHFVESTYEGAEVVYGDTDSVMIRFGQTTDVAECFRRGQEAAEAATRLFRDPVKLEFEKVFHPYFLFAKKRYCGVKITSLEPSAEPTLDFKGIQLARRDNCPLVRAVSRKVLDALMFRRDPEAAAAIVREAATDLLEGRVDVADLVLSKTLKPESSYKNPDQPHVHVARKIEQRRGVAGSGPRSGERVPYVFVEAEDPAALQYTKAEDPDHVREHGDSLRVDALYYLEHQLESPMITLFELLIPDPQKTLFDDLKAPHVARRTADLKEFKRKQRLKKDRQMEITTFFASKR